MENEKVNNLTARQERFCQEYLIDMNATQAAIRAGYSPKTANKHAFRLVVNGGILERISELRKEQEKRTEIRADYVLRNLKAIAERCMQLKPVMMKRRNEYVETYNYKFNSAGAIRALELLGKHLGLFRDVQIKRTDTIEDELEAMTEEELEGLRDYIREYLIKFRFKNRNQRN